MRKSLSDTKPYNHSIKLEFFEFVIKLPNSIHSICKSENVKNLPQSRATTFFFLRLTSPRNYV